MKAFFFACGNHILLRVGGETCMVISACILTILLCFEGIDQEYFESFLQ